ncbi:MAG: hypothetical protein ACP5XB_10355 [Isosphaeraceae bacterium]
MQEQEDRRKQLKNQLIPVIARGESVAEWAEQNQVARRTAFRWASSARVRREVDELRRRALDQAIGRLSGLAIKAAEGIAQLAQKAQSESVQLRAWRAILADQMAVAKFSNLEHRMLEIEELLDERNQQTDHAG